MENMKPDFFEVFLQIYKSFKLSLHWTHNVFLSLSEWVLFHEIGLMPRQMGLKPNCGENELIL